MTPQPEVIIDGHRLSAIMPWGDLEWTNCWPGGTESITFGVARSHHLFRPDALVELDYAGQRIAAGLLVEPTRGQPLMAEGHWRKAEDYAAVGPLPARDLAVTVHQAVDEAIIRGLPWRTRVHDLSPEPGIRGMPRLNPDQLHSVRQYLDQSAIERGQHWGVNPDRFVFMGDWLPASIHMLPGVDGLGMSRDGFASAILARYLDSATSLFTTITVRDEAAISRWGRVEREIAQPLGEGVPMGSSDAIAILQGVITQGRWQIGWATPLEVQYGDVVNEYGAPIDLNTIASRQTLRVHGLVEDVGDISGRSWVDMPIARDHHKGEVVTIEPRGLSSPMNDALAGISA